MSTNKPSGNRRTPAVAPALALLLAAAIAVPSAAGPEGPHVVRGDVTIERDGVQTIIHASDGSIIHYHSFDIAAGELVRFVHPSELARVLNRIDGTMPTRIDGTLLANGQVYLVNPAGIIFGQGSVIDVGRIYAAAGHIDDADFIAGVDRFHGLSGAVVNEGALYSEKVRLIGRYVANRGTIVAPQGTVTMLTGDEIVIRQHGDRISVIVDGDELRDAMPPATAGAPAGLATDLGVDNTGSVSADVGQIVLGAGDLYSLAIFNAGDLASPGGEIIDGRCRPAATATSALSIATTVKPLPCVKFVLDLTAPAPFSVAELIPRQPPMVDDLVLLDPFALRAMEKLGINVRSLDATELIAGLDGRELYDDVTGRPDPTSGERSITVSRLRRESVLLALERYTELFGSTDEQQTHVKRILEQAWDDYERRAPDALDPTTLRDFLAGRDNGAEALTYVNGLTSLFDQIRIMGLTRREMRISANEILGPITPPNMRRDQLERAIGLDAL